MSESVENGFQTTTRLGLEARIRDHFAAGDMNVVNDLLLQYPYGRPRPAVSLEVARHAVTSYVAPEDDGQVTDEFPAIEL